MEKMLVVSGYINRLALAIFLLTLSVGVSAAVLLAFMPTIQELSYELTRVNWGGFRSLLNATLIFLLFFLVAVVGVRLVFEKTKAPPKTEG